MADATCSVDGCGATIGPKSARGWCSRHYQRWLKNGTPTSGQFCANCDVEFERRSRHPGPRYCSPECRPRCAVEDCSEAKRHREWCSVHYQQWRRYGDASVPLKYKWSADYLCVVCGADVERGCGRRKHCSQSCQVADSRHKGERPSVAECTLCGREFPLSRRNGRLQRTDTKWCRDCGRDSPEAMRLKRYGITPEVYDAALERGCPICLRKVDSLHVDHDHGCCPARTHRLCGECTRGLLCGSCNRALGLLRDDPEAFARAQTYLTT